MATEQLGVPRTTTFIGSVNLVAQIADKLLSFAQIVLIAAMLGSSARGDLFFLASTVPLTIGFVVGEPVGRAYMTLLVRETSLDRARSLAASAFVLTLSLLIAVTVAYDLVAISLVRIAHPVASNDIWPWLAFSSIAPTMGIAGLLSGLLTWQHRYGWAAARTPLASLFGLLFLAIAVSVSSSLVGIAVAFGAGYLVTSVILLTRVTGILGRGWLQTVQRDRLGEAVTASRKMLLGPAAGGAIGGQVIVMLERVLASSIGTGFVASISYARGIATAPTVLAQAVGASGYPRLVNAAADRDDRYLRESFVRGLRLSLYLGLVTATFLIVFGPPAVGAIFQRGNFASAATAETSRALVAFSAATLTGSLLVYLVSVVYGLGRFSAILWLEAAVFVTYLVVAPLFRAEGGLFGLSSSFAVAQAAGVLVALLVCMKATRLGPTEVLRQVVLRVAPRAAIVIATLGVFRLTVAAVGVPLRYHGIVVVGGGSLCLIVVGTAVLLVSSLPEATQLRQFVVRR